MNHNYQHTKCIQLYKYIHVHIHKIAIPIQWHKKKSAYPLHTTINEADLAYAWDSRRGYSIHGIEYSINMERKANEAIYTKIKEVT